MIEILGLQALANDVRGDMRGALVPLDVTLAELASHRSGLSAQGIRNTRHDELC